VNESASTSNSGEDVNADRTAEPKTPDAPVMMTFVGIATNWTDGWMDGGSEQESLGPNNRSRVVRDIPDISHLWAS